MNKEKKSKKLLLIATALTIVALVSVMYAYAVQIGSFQGGEVTVGGVTSGTVTYSLDNSADATWSTTLQPATVSTSWYARLEIGDGNAYSGPVTITWQLQIETGSNTWSNVSSSVPTTFPLATGSQYIYASSIGTITSNTDWSTVIGTADSGNGTYRVTATFGSV